MNIGTKESAIRLITGFLFLVITGFIFIPPTLWILAGFWIVSVYLLLTGIFFKCPVYKLLGIKKNT